MTTIISKDVKFTLFNSQNVPADFAPWTMGQKTEQTFLKLTKENETALLYLGENPLIPDEVQKTIIQLTKDGWKMQGKLNLYFDGKMHPDISILFDKSLLCLEIGTGLLPLIDPVNNAPILDALANLRNEFAVNTGFMIPGINIKDNLRLSPNEYILKIKNNPVSKGEIFLDRFFVLAPQEKLDKLKGWIAVDPTFKVRAKWIEESEKKTAEKEKCLIISPLNVLITNIKETIKLNVKDIMGLQELRYLLERIYQTHPIVVEDFLKDTHKLRMLKVILRNLLGENVIIKDIINILEIVGENFEHIGNTDLVTEIVRFNIAPQICWQYLDIEDKLNVFCFEKKLEQKISHEYSAANKMQRHFILTPDEIEEIITLIKETINEHPEVRVVMAPADIRLFLNKLLSNHFPYLAFISTAEAIYAKVKLRIIDEIKHKKLVDEVVDKKTKKKGLWGKKNNK